MKTPLLIIITMLLWIPTLHAKYYEFAELERKELDEMQDLIRDRLNRAKTNIAADVEESEVEKKEQAAVEDMREVLVVIFSRPDKDRMIQTLIDTPRTDLRRLKAYDEALLTIANSAIRMAKDKTLTASQRATQFFVLQNIMIQARGELKKNETIRKVFESIRDAELETDETLNKVLSKSLYKPIKISETAGEVLKKDISGGKK